MAQMAQMAKTLKGDLKKHKETELTRNDSKTIPNDLLLVWLAQKILEEYGTIAEDLETNVDKIICRYNAGKVKK